MSETKDSIRSCIQNLIKDNTTQAEVDLHPVFTTKMKEIAGIQSNVDNEPVSNEPEEETE